MARAVVIAARRWPEEGKRDPLYAQRSLYPGEWRGRTTSLIEVTIIRPEDVNFFADSVYAVVKALERDYYLLIMATLDGEAALACTREEARRWLRGEWGVFGSLPAEG